MLFKKEGRIKIVFSHTKAAKLHQQQICTMKNIKASLSGRRGKIVRKKKMNRTTRKNRLIYNYSQKF